jgi:methylenetetrahydrofolate--tRNA-(uracil-5-)-methyltransferase
MEPLTIIGAGLAGSEAAWQAAELGVSVNLYEMRPSKNTGAHITSNLAELVCSNSLGSNLVDRASGLLKEELRRLESMLLASAEQTAIPAGGALAVDRQQFSDLVTRRIENHPRIKIFREEVTTIPSGVTIIASGPLTSPSLTQAIQTITGEDRLFFYDAIAPIVMSDSINMNMAFRASRYGHNQQEDGDYINCPFQTEETYHDFVEALKSADRIQLHDFENQIESGVTAGMDRYFEGCLPVEIIARRGEMALAFGPMRPVGLRDPRTGQRPFAVVQLRQDDLAGSMHNLVGFQTNLTFPEQRRIFRMIPGLEQAEFVRYGQMHRNTFIASPVVLHPTLQTRFRDDLFFAGQITGVEGYMGNIATGLLAGWNAVRWLMGKPLLSFPPTTMLGALCHYVTNASLRDFQPMKANFGILPELAVRVKGKRARAAEHAQRSLNELERFINGYSSILNR